MSVILRLARLIPVFKLISLVKVDNCEIFCLNAFWQWGEGHARVPLLYSAHNLELE